MRVFAAQLCAWHQIDSVGALASSAFPFSLITMVEGFKKALRVDQLEMDTALLPSRTMIHSSSISERVAMMASFFPFTKES